MADRIQGTMLPPLSERGVNPNRVRNTAAAVVGGAALIGGATALAAAEGLSQQSIAAPASGNVDNRGAISPNAPTFQKDGQFLNIIVNSTDTPTPTPTETPAPPTPTDTPEPAPTKDPFIKDYKPYVPPAPPQTQSAAEAKAKQDQIMANIVATEQALRTIKMPPTPTARPSQPAQVVAAPSNPNNAPASNPNTKPSTQPASQPSSPDKSQNPENNTNFPKDFSSGPLTFHNLGTSKGVVPGNIDALAKAAQQFIPGQKFEFYFYDNPQNVPSPSQDTNFSVYLHAPPGKEAMINKNGVWQLHYSIPDVKPDQVNNLSQRLTQEVLIFMKVKDGPPNWGADYAAVIKQLDEDPLNDGSMNFPLKAAITS